MTAGSANFATRLSGRLAPEATTPLDRRIVLSVLAAVVVVFFLPSAANVINPFRWFTTLVHETGHAVATVLVGGDVVDMTINRRGGGLTRSRVPPSVWAQIVVGSAGYLSSSALGAALLLQARRLKSGQFLLQLLAAGAVAVAVAWVPWSTSYLDTDAAASAGSGVNDGRFTWGFCLGIAAILLLVSVAAPVRIRQVFVVGLAALACCSALDDLLTLLGISASSNRHSDAQGLADVTLVPAVLWAALWLFAAASAVWFALRSLTR